MNVNKDIITMIPAVDAGDMPQDVEEYCDSRGWSTHCDNDIVQVEDDGNPFAEWLKANGIVFTKDRHQSIGIWGT